jgi:hypothetical protein
MLTIAPVLFAIAALGGITLAKLDRESCTEQPSSTAEFR